MSHELHHAELGHFELLDGLPAMHLISRGEVQTTPIDDLSKELWPDVRPCLELQADHDAISDVLGIYKSNGWEGLRIKIASICAVMILIEKEDAKHEHDLVTHPKAATRIFQLLGHVSEMGSHQAHMLAEDQGRVDPAHLPSDDEIARFSLEVILPAYHDAIALAGTARAESITDDLGEADAFFSDIACAKLGQWDGLQTFGAQQWAQLKDTNDLILPLLPQPHGLMDTSST